MTEGLKNYRITFGKDGVKSIKNIFAKDGLDALDKLEEMIKTDKYDIITIERVED